MYMYITYKSKLVCSWPEFVWVVEMWTPCNQGHCTEMSVSCIDVKFLALDDRPTDIYMNYLDVVL